MRFIAKDLVNTAMPNTGQNTIEAALDDFTIYDIAISDLNVSGLNGNAVISVFPNPANDKLNVFIPAVSEGTITLHDITGRLLSEQVINSSINNYIINTSGLATGQYLLTVKTAKTSEVKKVVISH